MNREEMLSFLVKDVTSWGSGHRGCYWYFKDSVYCNPEHDPITIHDWNRAKIVPNTKIRILSPVHSEYVQKLAFEAGFEWADSLGKSIHRPDAPHLYFDGDTEITFGATGKVFDSKPYKEIFIEMPEPNIDARVLAEKVGALDVQVGGDHYKDQKIQPVEYIHANDIGYFEGNVIKYVTRWRKKNGIADLEKARHYIDLLIDLEQNK